MKKQLFWILALALIFVTGSQVEAGPGERTTGSGGGDQDGVPTQSFCSAYPASNKHSEWVENQGSKTIRVYSIKINDTSTIDGLTHGSICGNGSKKFKVFGTGNTKTLKPHGSNYYTLQPGQSIFLGILLNKYDEQVEPKGYDWRFYNIEGPSSMPAWTYDDFEIGGTSTVCSFNWSVRELPSGSWHSSGSGGDTRMWITNKSRLLKVSHSCPGDNGTRYKTVHLQSNKAASVDSSPVLNEDLEIVSDESKAVSISPNYPNPFNPTTRIEFELFNEQEVDLSVFDLTGRKVETLMSGTLGAGQHAATFDASRLPNGTYLYILTHEAGRVVNRMTLLK